MVHNSEHMWALNDQAYFLVFYHHAQEEVLTEIAKDLTQHAWCLSQGHEYGQTYKDDTIYKRWKCQSHHIS